MSRDIRRQEMGKERHPYGYRGFDDEMAKWRAEHERRIAEHRSRVEREEKSQKSS